MQHVGQHRVSLDTIQAKKTISTKLSKGTKGLKPNRLKAEPSVRSRIHIIPRCSGHNRVSASLVIGCLGSRFFLNRQSEHWRHFDCRRSDLRTEDASQVSVDSTHRGACRNRYPARASSQSLTEHEADAAGENRPMLSSGRTFGWH